MFATTIGLRGNATAIAVPSWMRSVASAAKASGMNGSFAISGVVMPSKPSASARCAAGATARQSLIGMPVSMRIAVLLLAAKLKLVARADSRKRARFPA